MSSINPINPANNITRSSENISITCVIEFNKKILQKIYRKIEKVIDIKMTMPPVLGTNGFPYLFTSGCIMLE
jgi:hypothetical protein